MTIYNWLCLLGIPSAILAIIGYLKVKIREISSKQKAIELGLQAMLRAELIRIYNYWYPKGQVPKYVMDNFENCYTNYHALGANGVMDKIYDDFMALKVEPQK